MFSLIQLAISPQSSTYLVPTLHNVATVIHVFPVVPRDILNPVGTFKYQLTVVAVTFCDSCMQQQAKAKEIMQEARGIHQA